MRELVLCIIAALLVAGAVSQACPKSTCASWDSSLPVFWLNTSTMNTRIHGPLVTFYARQPNGEAYAPMPAGLSVDYLGEVILHRTFQNCSSHSAIGTPMRSFDQFQADSRIARYMNISEACCEVIHLTNEPVPGAPGVTTESYLVNITHPSYPDFYAQYIASTPSQSYSVPRPATPEIGSGYNITSEYSKVKLDLNVYNWPWIADEHPEQYPNNTFLTIFLNADTHFDNPGHLGVVNDGKLIKYQAITETVRIRMDLLKVYTTDGVDRYSPQNDVLDSFGNIPIYSAFNLSLPTILCICQGEGPVLPRFSKLVYDPSLDALFLSPTGSPKSRLNPAVYAVPVAVVGVIIIAGAIYAFIIRPKLNGESLERLHSAAANAAEVQNEA